MAKARSKMPKGNVPKTQTAKVQEVETQEAEKQEDTVFISEADQYLFAQGGRCGRRIFRCVGD